MIKKLLFSLTQKDFVFQTFCSGGKGGQSQNKRETGCRYSHLPSGAVGECREERHQAENKKRAFQRMAEHPKMVAWLKLKAAELASGETVEQAVDHQMEDCNLLVEQHTEAGWEPYHEQA